MLQEKGFWLWTKSLKTGGESSRDAIALDDALDLLDILITDIFADATRAGEKARLRTIKDLDEAAGRLGQVCALLQCAAAQNAKPAFHLIEPAAVCRDEMKMDLGMGFEPAILLGFMRIEIVQHNVNQHIVRN